MQRSLHSLTRLAAILTLAATVVLAVAPAGFGDDWAHDRSSALAAQQLDPAIRIAIATRTAKPSPVAVVRVSTPAADDRFAWGAAALGLGVGVAGMCVVLGCVTLVRHDGRLRSA